MKKVFLFLAEGFEEIEAVATIDVLRRGNLDVTTVSITGDYIVNGVHNIPVTADTLFEDVDFASGALLVFPGGMPGASNLNAHKGLKTLLVQFNESGKLLAAICAAPLVLGGLGILKDKNATCYPSFEPYLLGANITGEPVVKDGNIITGKGPGFAVQFGLEIVKELQGQAIAEEVAKGMLLN